MREQKVFDLTRSLMSGQMRGLEQTVSLRPFMGKSVMLAQIAEWTCYYQIGYIIRTSATQGNDMVNVVNILSMFLFKFCRTIVTFIALPFQLLLNLCVGMRTRGIYFSCASSLIACSEYIACLWGFIPCVAHSTILRVYVRSMIIDFLFLIQLISVFATVFCQICFVVGFMPILYFGAAIIQFAVSLSVGFYFWALKISLLMFSPMFLNFGAFKILLLISFSSCLYFWACFTYFSDCLAMFLNFWIATIYLLMAQFTCFASGFQAIFLPFVAVKEFRSSGEKLFALCALFLRRVWGYNIHTEETAFLSSRSGVLPAPPEYHNILSSYYTTNQPQKQVQGVFL